MLKPDEIRDRFQYHPPSSEGVEAHAGLTEWFVSLGGFIEKVCPDGREKSLVMTKLEEAKMWASAAVARNPDTR